MLKFFWDLELLSWKINIYRHVIAEESRKCTEGMDLKHCYYMDWMKPVCSCLWWVTLKKHISRNSGLLNMPSKLNWGNYMDLLLPSTISVALLRPREKANTDPLEHRVLPPMCTDQKENCITHSHSKTFIFICSCLLAESDQNDCPSTVTELEFIIIIIFNVKQLSLQGEI